MSKIKTKKELKSLSKNKLIDIIIGFAEVEAIRKEQFETQRKIIENQQIMIENLEQEIKALKKDSSNSSRPPSADNGNKPKKNQSLREKSGKRPGGQKGHAGATRKQEKEPDQIIPCRPKHCEHCGKDLSGLPGEIIAARQESDIPPIKITVVEYQQIKLKCGCGHCNKGAFPEHINAPAQFGPNIKSFIAYLNVAHKIPYYRLQQIFRHMLNIHISEGTIENALDKFYLQSRPILPQILSFIKKDKWAGSDETGTHINGKKFWQWVWQNAKNSYYAVSASRGYRVVKEFFGEDYWGVLIHDCWSAQNNTIAKLGHQLCHPHLTRDLNYLIDAYKNAWCYRMKQLLLSSQKARDKIWEKGFKRKLRKKVIAEYDRRLQALLAEDLSGRKEIAAVQKRFRKHREKILLFMNCKDMPFHNNSSEQAIRNFKIHKKVSGGFRSIAGAERHAAILSVIETCKKRDLDIFDSLKSLYLGTFSLAGS